MGNLARHFLMPAVIVSIVGTLWAMAWAQELTQEARRAGSPNARPIQVRRVAATPSASGSLAVIDSADGR